MNVADGGQESDADDPVLAGLAEQITRRLQSGDAVAVDDYADLSPARAGSIRRLLSVLDELTALGRSMAGRRLSAANRTAADDNPEMPMKSRRRHSPEESEP